MLIKIAIILVCVVAVLILLGWLGLQTRPKPWPSFPQRTSTSETIPLPADLPAPVERFYRQIYGERVPVIESDIINNS